MFSKHFGGLENAFVVISKAPMNSVECAADYIATDNADYSEKSADCHIFRQSNLYVENRKYRYLSRERNNETDGHIGHRFHK
jgi:hypothetical protein